MTFRFHTRDRYGSNLQIVEADSEDAAKAEYLKRMSSVGNLSIVDEWSVEHSDLRHGTLRHRVYPDYRGEVFWKKENANA